jgi:hypothetical protein
MGQTRATYITLGRWGRSDTISFVCLSEGCEKQAGEREGTHRFDVHRVGVCFAVNCHGLDAELSCCSDDPTCDLTTIRKNCWKGLGCE